MREKERERVRVRARKRRLQPGQPGHPIRFAKLAFSRPKMTILAFFLIAGLEIYEDLLSGWLFLKFRVI